jgi:hypothetical protein
MPILRLETPEATFINDMSGYEHFMIDCACKGKDGAYHGSHYKNASEITEETTKRYSPLNHSYLLEHTFYLSELLLLDNLKWEHKASEGKSPLIVVCNDCEREFPFTLESYFELKDRMMRAYNQKLREKESENKD